MKKTAAVFIIFLFAISGSSQQLNLLRPGTENAYASGENSKRTVGKILAGGGAALVLGGIIVRNSTRSYFPDESVGTIMMIGGGAAVVTGIILISSAGKKNQGGINSLELKMEHALAFNQGTVENNYFPALTYKIHMRKK